MSLKYLVMGGAALIALIPTATLAEEAWTGLNAAPAAAPAAPGAVVFDPAAPRGAAPAAPAAPFVLAPVEPATPEAPAAGETTQFGEGGIDESALRYYASRNDVARVAAEIRRLRALHPDWQPPEDLFSSASGPSIDLAPLWALFGAGRFDELRAAIEQLKAQNPGFQPPAELTTKLDEAQATAYLVQASEAGDHGRVLAIARNFPGIMVCERLDVLWRVAESLAKSGDNDRAFSAYDYILTTCPGAAERVATVQKASELLPEPAVKALLARGKVKMDGTSEFDVVLLDFARRRIGDAIGKADLGPADPADIARISTEARVKKSVGDANLIGWYQYARKDYAAAETWFRTALTFGEDLKSLEGLILSLRAKGDLAAAEAMAYDNRAKGPEIGKVYIEIVSGSLTEKNGVDVPAEKLAAFAEVVDAQKSDLGAQSLGWYLFNHADFAAAGPWFDKSMEWKANQEAALGQVLTAQRLKNNKQFKALVAEYADKYPSVKALQTSGASVAVAAGDGRVNVSVKRKKSADASLTREAVALYESKKYREAIERLEKIRESGRETTDLAVLRGWAYYNIREYRQAKDIFENANSRKSTSETRTGLYYSSQKLRAPIYQR